MQVFAQICRFEAFRSKAAQFVGEAGANPLYNLLKEDGEMSRRIQETEDRFDAWRQALEDFRRDLVKPPFGINLAPILFPPEVGDRDDPMTPASFMTPASSLFSAGSREDTDCPSPATSVVSAILPDSTLSVISENVAPGIPEYYDFWSGCHQSPRPSVLPSLQPPLSLYSSWESEEFPESCIGSVKCGRETAASSDAHVAKYYNYGLSGDEGSDHPSQSCGSMS